MWFLSPDENVRFAVGPSARIVLLSPLATGILEFAAISSMVEVEWEMSDGES